MICKLNTKSTKQNKELFCEVFQKKIIHCDLLRQDKIMQNFYLNKSLCLFED